MAPRPRVHVSYFVPRLLLCPERQPVMGNAGGGGGDDGGGTSRTGQ